MMQTSPSASESDSDESAQFEDYNLAAESLAHLDDMASLSDEALRSAFPDAAPNSSNVIEVMHANVDASCQEFVHTFLSQRGSMSDLQQNLTACDATLGDVQTSLARYLKRIEKVNNDIGALQSKSTRTSMALVNTLAIQRISESVLNAVFVPPDTVKLILNASETELGTQFILEVRRLGELISNRRKGFVVVDQRGVSQTIDITRMTGYAESSAVVKRISAVACLKIRNFLLQKFETTLGKGRTNIAVLQQNVLRDYRPLLVFLRDAGAVFDDPIGNPATVFYEELRRRYCSMLSSIYLNNIKLYILQCNALETEARISTRSASTASSSSFGLFGSSKHTAVAQPCLTDRSASITGEDFALGQRGHILENIRAMPIIPVVSRRQEKKHSYEETFRSLQVVLTDAVTSEFLFSFDFFGGDSSVYVDVFKPCVQLIVDYVAEVILRDTTTQANQTKQFTNLQSAKNINSDYCGLLILIRLVHLFKVNMHTRRLSCLDGYFDSLLLLLWPAFKVAFDRQLSSMRTCTVQNALAFLTPYRTDIDRLTAIHPITHRYVQLSFSLMTLSRGIEESQTDALPQQLYAMLGGKHTSIDETESTHRFAVLESNLAYVRIEFERIIKSVAEELLGNLARSAPGFPLTIVKSVYLVNNYFAVLSVWSVLESGTNELLSPASPPSENSDFFTTAWLDIAPATHSQDYRALHAAYLAASREVASEVVRLQCPNLFAAVEQAKQSATPLSPNYVAQVGKAFVASSKDDVAAIAATVRKYVSDPTNASMVIKTAFSSLMVANTAFHSLATASLGHGAPQLRLVVVTSQALVTGMKLAV